MDKDKSLMKENLTTMQIKELLEMLDVMKGKITGLEEELKERLIIEKLMMERKDDKKEMDLPHHLSVKDISEYTRLSKGRVYEFMRINPEYSGFPSFRIGKSVLTKREDFLMW